MATWLTAIEPGSRGLEIGALDKPVFDRGRWDVRYVDHATRAELMAKYAQDDAQREHLDDIVEVDIVWAGAGPLVDLVDDAPLDFVFASHVFEHVPDPIGWLGKLAAVLREGGLVCLAIPDKRLCFDVNRADTEMSDLIDAHLRALESPSYRQIYDFHSKIVAVDAAEMWAGTVDYSGTWRDDLDPDGWAYELCLRSRDAGEYVDGHCNVFTPSSFLDVYERMCRLGLVDYAIRFFEPSQPGTIEFHVILEKLPTGLSDEERLSRQLSSIPTTIEDLVPPPPVEPRPPADAGDHRPTGLAPGASWMGVSDRERALIDTKRKMAARLRSLPSLVRRGATRTSAKG